MILKNPKTAGSLLVHAAAFPIPGKPNKWRGAYMIKISKGAGISESLAGIFDTEDEAIHDAMEIGVARARVM